MTVFQNSVPDLSAIAEQLCRVEHKLDLLLEYFAMKDGEFPLRGMLDERNMDPVTQGQVTYNMDLFKRHVVRNTMLGTGLVGPFSALFQSQITPTPEGSGNNGGNEE